MARDVYSFSVGEYDKEGQELMDNVLMYIERNRIKKSVLVRDALALYYNEIIKPAEDNGKYKRG